MEDWSNEKMREKGKGRSTMPGGTGPVLDAQTAALVRVATAVARGKVPELKARFAAARDARVPGLWIEELLLQSMLVVGYPLALVAFGVWRGIDGPAPVEGDGAEDLAHADWESWAARGAAVCREVYGRAYHKLLVKRRELCTVATTALLGTGEQLHSHLRGALNTGASAAEIDAVLGAIDGDLDAELRGTAREQWEDVKERK